MWDLPGPGIEPVSPALAGRLLTTGPKPGDFFFLKYLFLGKKEKIYLATSGLSCRTQNLRCLTRNLLLWCVVSLVMAHGLSNRGVWAQLPEACRVLLPQSGIEPVSPALQGKFFTTGPSQRSSCLFLEYNL